MAVGVGGAVTLAVLEGAAGLDDGAAAVTTEPLDGGEPAHEPASAAKHSHEERRASARDRFTREPLAEPRHGCTVASAEPDGQSKRALASRRAPRPLSPTAPLATTTKPWQPFSRGA